MPDPQFDSSNTPLRAPGWIGMDIYQTAQPNIRLEQKLTATGTSTTQHSQMFASNKIVPQQEPQFRASRRAHQYKPCHHREAVDQKGRGHPSPEALPMRTCPHIAPKVVFVTKSSASVGRD